MKLFISLLAALVIVGHAQDDAASPDKKGIDDFQELEERDLLDEEARELEEDERQLSDDGIQGFKRQIDDGQFTNMAARQSDDGQPTNAEARQIDDGQLTSAEARQLADLTSGDTGVAEQKRFFSWLKYGVKAIKWARKVVNCKKHCRRRGYRGGKCRGFRIGKLCKKSSCNCY